MTNVPRLNLICGVSRSGTTFVREIARRATHSLVIEEAMNRGRGVINQPTVYPYVAASGGQYASFIDDIITFSRPWQRSLPVNSRHRGIIGRGVYRTVGGRWKIQWELLRISARLKFVPSSVLWKDPFAVLATPYLIDHYNARVVCMIRHPAAVFVSMQRRGWHFNIKHLRKQAELMNAYGGDVESNVWKLAEHSNSAALAILWKLMVRVTRESEAGGCGGMLRVRHEDLCRDPFPVATTILAQFGLNMTHAARRFIGRSTQGDKAVSKHTHDFVRNSGALVDDWRRKIAPEDEATLRDIIGDDFHCVYREW